MRVEPRRQTQRLSQIPSSEQVQMVEQVIQAVEQLALFVAFRQRPEATVFSVEAPRKAAEQFAHGQIRFAVTVMHRGVEDCGRTVGEHGRVAVPEIAVHQACARAIVQEQGRYSSEQALALFLQFAAEAVCACEGELRAQPMLDEEQRPVVGGGVELWRAAEMVVASPAKLRAGVLMQLRQRLRMRTS